MSGFDENTSVSSGGTSGRTFNLLKAEYAFEDLDDGAPRVPLSAQRALDAAGRRLTVDGWRSLSAADQKVLMLAGAGDEVDAAVVRSIGDRARPAPTECDALVEAGRYELPGALVEALGRARPIDVDRWSSATALDRYVLVRLRIDPEELARAYDEIFTPSVPQAWAVPRPNAAPAAAEPTPKAPTLRRAVATARVVLRQDLLSRVMAARSGSEVLAAARAAGMLAAKRAPELVPLCAVTAVTRSDVTFAVDPHGSALLVRSKVEAFASGPVSTEALLAASTAAVTVVDYLRPHDRWITVAQLRLEEISGGEAGELKRP